MKITTAVPEGLADLKAIWFFMLELTRTNVYNLERMSNFVTFRTFCFSFNLLHVDFLGTFKVYVLFPLRLTSSLAVAIRKPSGNVPCSFPEGYLHISPCNHMGTFRECSLKDPWNFSVNLTTTVTFHSFNLKSFTLNTNSTILKLILHLIFIRQDWYKVWVWWVPLLMSLQRAFIFQDEAFHS